MALPLPLIRLADNAELAASRLHNFRGNVPRQAAHITAIVSKLFDVSAVLRVINQARGDPHYQGFFYHARESLDLFIRSFQSTLDLVLRMLDQSGNGSPQTCWDDLDYRMGREEGLDLLERMRIYYNFLEAQRDSVSGEPPGDLPFFRRQIVALLESQEAARPPTLRGGVNDSISSRPRPPQRRSWLQLLQPSGSATVVGDGLDHARSPTTPPVVSDVHMRRFSRHYSPTRRTSYANEVLPLPRTQLIHWAQQVFDGSYPSTPFRPSHQLDTSCKAYGTVEPFAISDLSTDEFVDVLELPFDRERMWVRLYWRPNDNRARIFISDRDNYGRESHYCTPLTNLKIIRNRSCLELYRVRQDGVRTIWATLNFTLYERMVLFYCTFVAMKHQDNIGILAPDLLDKFGLISEDDEGEYEVFRGIIIDEDQQQSLRLFRDRGSDVVRLEASALVGPMRGAPLWVAFLTRHAYDPDWAWLESGSLVSLAAIRPQPYVFLFDYELPQNSDRHYLLDFETRDGARDFIQRWTGLCRGST